MSTLPPRRTSTDGPASPVWDAAACGHGPYLSHAALANGFRVAVRPLRAMDRDQLAVGFGHLSEQSRYRRFLGPKRTLGARDLDVLVSGADQQRHIAVALVWPRTSCDDIVLGVAHAFRLAARPDTADVAVTVVDDLHGQGGGRLLMAVLADAAVERGITGFTATMLASNSAAARLLTRLGSVEDDQIREGVRDLTVRLSARGAVTS